MTSRTSPDSGNGCLAALLTVAGILFIISGGLFLYPIIRDELQPVPATFGEAQPLLRPTVTPVGMPDVLPETPLLAPNQSPPPGQSPSTWSTATPETPDRSTAIPKRIVIPAIHLDAPIEMVGWNQVNDGSTWNIPNHFAAGWLKTSAPLGQLGNTVLDGHHNMAGEVFRYLVDLKPGDVIDMYSGNRGFQFVVTGLHILPDRDQPIEVRRQNAAWIQPTLDERLTLVTCWPYTSNTHRLIVVAQPIAVSQSRNGSSD